MIWRVVCCAMWSDRTTWPRPNRTPLVFDSPYQIDSNRFAHRINSNSFFPALVFSVRTAQHCKIGAHYSKFYVVSSHYIFYASIVAETVAEFWLIINQTVSHLMVFVVSYTSSVDNYLKSKINYVAYIEMKYRRPQEFVALCIWKLVT